MLYIGDTAFGRGLIKYIRVRFCLLMVFLLFRFNIEVILIFLLPSLVTFHSCCSTEFELHIQLYAELGEERDHSITAASTLWTPNECQSLFGSPFKVDSIVTRTSCLLSHHNAFPGTIERPERPSRLKITFRTDSSNYVEATALSAPRAS